MALFIRRNGGAPATPLLLVALLLIAGACSSGGADVTQTSGFMGDYRRVTERYRASIDDIQAQAQNSSDQGLNRIVALYEDLLDVTESALDDYSQLRPPEDLEDTFDRIVTLIGRQVDALDALVASAKKEDLSGVSEAASELTELMAEWNSAHTRMDEVLQN